MASGGSVAAAVIRGSVWPLGGRPAAGLAVRLPAGAGRLGHKVLPR